MRGELPAGWVTCALADLAEVNPRTQREIDLSDSAEVHFVPMSAVAPEFGGIDVSQRRAFSEVRKGYTQFTENDVLFAKITPCMENGKLAVVPELPERLGFGSTEFHVLRSGEAVRPAWLAHFLSQVAFRKTARQNMTGSAGQLRVSTPWLSSVTLPVPPLAEQTRIVEKLEELLSDLDAGVAELKAAQVKLQHYRQSLLKAAVEGSLTAAWREANPAPEETGADLLARILRERRARWEAQQLAKFEAQGKKPPKGWKENYVEPVRPEIDGLPLLPINWTWASLEQITADEKYSLAIGPFGSNLTVPDYRDEGVPLVFVRNIRSGQFGGQSTRYVTPEKAGELTAHEVAAGDVLITKMGEPPGDACVYPADQPLAIITADCIKVRCAESLMQPKFLEAVVNSYIGKQQIKPMTQGVAQKKVSLGRFSKLAVPVPPPEEQTVILSKLIEAEQEALGLADALAQSLRQSTAQRQNLLRAAFAGQLVPQDPADEPAAELLARIRAERAATEPAAKRNRSRKVTA